MNQVTSHQQHQAPAQQPRNTALASLAARFNINEQEVHNIVMRTLVSAKDNQQPTNEEFVTFLAIASEYKLNPLTKEIYAFSNRGTVQPIVSIDGWLKIINSHPQFDGMEFQDSLDANGNLISVTCSIYRKDRSRPTQVTEYMAECAGRSDPWKRWPARMLRHKSAIQGARYAFGLSGFFDPDEADRIQSTEKDITPNQSPVSAALNSSPITPEQCQQLLQAAEFVGKDEAYICNVARIGKITELQASRFNGALNHLKGLAMQETTGG